MSKSAAHGPDATPAGQPLDDESTESIDRFDLAGREIAELLRSSSEATKRSQLEAERQSRAMRERARLEADATAAARLAAADRQAEEIRADAMSRLDEAERTRAAADAWSDQIADSRMEATRLLDEVLGHLDRAVEEIARLERQAAATRAEIEAARQVLAFSTEDEAEATPPSPGASTDLVDQPPTDPAEPPAPGAADANRSEIMPPTTAAGLGVTEVVRSAVQKAVAQRRGDDRGGAQAYGAPC